VDISSAERARLQTVEEWLLEYETGKPVMPGTCSKESTQDQCISLFQFESHRTTMKSRLVMALIDKETREEVDAFFNVDIMRKRGKHKGTTYRIGVGGQFNVTPRHKFFKFWMDAVGEKPRKWCRVHKEMKSKLGGLIFTGKLSTGYREDGSPFTQVKHLQKLDTREAQTIHILDKMKAREECTTI